MKMKRLRSRLTMALLALFLSRLAAWAYPPAPDILIYGLVKDQYGNPLVNPADLVILQTTSGTQVVANIQPNLAIGVNYALQIPMDSGSIPVPYVSNALTSGVSYQIFVVVSSTTNLPIEMQGVHLTLGAPSQLLEQNLTLGQGLGASGVPLQWAEAFLASLGLNVAAGSINPYGVYTQDGRTLQQEYELGNFPYQTNAFSVRIVSQNAGSATLSFTTAVGHTYSATGSSDLVNWAPVSFAIPAAGPTAMTSFYSSTNQAVQIQTILSGSAPKFQFFRLQLH